VDEIKKLIREVLSEKKVKRDRCLRIADRKYDKPSAYKSGAVVKCRKGMIWKGIKEENINEASGNFKLPYKMGGIDVTGEEAWNNWKMLLDRNRRNDFAYKILDSIKKQNYITTPKQYQVLIDWYNKGSSR
jgi:hypothetical protein